MASEDQLKTLIVTVRQNVVTSAEKATLEMQQLIQQLRATGMSDLEIRNRLLLDFVDSNPRFFGTFKNEIRDYITGGQGQAYQAGVMDQYSGTDQMMTWTLDNDAEHCDDCLARAGQVRPAREWEIAGLPKSGFSRCGTNCRCELTAEEVGAPAMLAGGIGE